jgi:hypothetical protein
VRRRSQNKVRKQSRKKSVRRRSRKVSKKRSRKVSKKRSRKNMKRRVSKKKSKKTRRSRRRQRGGVEPTRAPLRVKIDYDKFVNEFGQLANEVERLEAQEDIENIPVRDIGTLYPDGEKPPKLIVGK